MRSAITILVCAVALSSGGIAQDSLQSRIDSVEMASQRVLLKMTDVEISRTDLLHRLLPRVTFSASFGMHDMLFSEIPVAYVIPRDSYRLTLSFSLDEIMNTSRHESALLAREKQGLELMNVVLRQKSEYIRRQYRAKALREQLSLLQEELKLHEKIVGFNQMMFEEGGVKFDALARAKLQVIGVKERIGRLVMEIEQGGSSVSKE